MKYVDRRLRSSVTNDNLSNVNIHTHRERAVYRGLLSVLGDERAAQEIFSRWAIDYRANPRFIVTVVANDLVKMAGLADNKRSELMRSVFFAISSPADELPAVPASAYQFEKLPPTSVPAPIGTVTAIDVRSDAKITPQGEIFLCVAEALFNSLKSRFGSLPALRQGLIDLAHAKRLSEPLSRRLVELCNRDFRSLPSQISLLESDMRDIVHILYLQTCESLGPVVADRTLTQAVVVAERLPSAQKFPPGQLL